MPSGGWKRSEESKANYRKFLRKRLLKELGITE